MKSRDLPHYPKLPSICPLPDFKYIEPSLHYIIGELNGMRQGATLIRCEKCRGLHELTSGCENDEV